MLRRQAFKFELMPDGDQARDRRRFAGSCRFVFNKALAMQQERHAAGEKKLGYAGLCKCLTEWRNSPETPWLADAPMHPLQQTLKDLERAYANFFAKRADFPRFKKKGRSDDSFRYPDPQQFRLDHVSVAQENRQTQARFAGVECGFEENADLVGAINVLRAGHARLACGDTSLVGASAQEPAEATMRKLACA